MGRVNSIILKFGFFLTALTMMIGKLSPAFTHVFRFNQPEMFMAVEKFKKNI